MRVSLGGTKLPAQYEKNWRCDAKLQDSCEKDDDARGNAIEKLT